MSFIIFFIFGYKIWSIPALRVSLYFSLKHRALTPNPTLHYQGDIQGVSPGVWIFSAESDSLGSCSTMSSSPTQMNTQPLEDAPLGPVTSQWGNGEVMKVGRDPSCDLMLNEVIFMGSTDEDLQLAKISRAQFELQRTGTNLVLKDKAMNGTYMLLLCYYCHVT